MKNICITIFATIKGFHAQKTKKRTANNSDRICHKTTFERIPSARPGAMMALQKTDSFGREDKGATKNACYGNEQTTSDFYGEGLRKAAYSITVKHDTTIMHHFYKNVNREDSLFTIPAALFKKIGRKHIKNAGGEPAFSYAIAKAIRCLSNSLPIWF